MAKFYVEGGHSIQGRIRPSGNKNEALPVIAASLMTREKIHLRNVPFIGDVETMLSILEHCGVQVEKDTAHEITLHAETITNTEFPEDLCRQIRASVVLLAPMLVRCGKVRLPMPGGDRIGRRRVDTHFIGLQELGAQFKIDDGFYYVWTEGPLRGADILLDEASVTATENLVMAAALAQGTTVLHNAASEPHVQQLCHFLNQMGAKISGIGSNVLTIEGVEPLGGADHRIGADYLEVGSFIALTAVTDGELTIEDSSPEYMRMILYQFKRLGIHVEVHGKNIFVPKNQTLKIIPDFQTAQMKIDDGPWPAFPADMTSIATVLATQTEGTVMIFEKMFESRLFFVDRLISMGANIILCDPHRAVVVGPTPLHYHVMSSPDIRAGMALLIAALCAEGTSEIQNIEQIDRGYEKLDERLLPLGAKVRRVE